MFSIEEVASRSGLTKRTIRYYEEVGILAAPDRTSGGHRVYTDSHIQTLERIVFLKETLGYSLVDLKEYLEVRREVESLVPVLRQGPSPEQRQDHLNRIRSLLLRQSALMEAQLAKLHTAREETQRLIDRVDKALDGT